MNNREALATVLELLKKSESYGERFKDVKEITEVYEYAEENS